LLFICIFFTQILQLCNPTNKLKRQKFHLFCNENNKSSAGLRVAPGPGRRGWKRKQEAQFLVNYRVAEKAQNFRSIKH
jgi:hypothetical protein